MVSIGERIRELRKQRGITQQDLAEQLNVSRSAVSNWEVGRNYPDLDTIVQLSDLLEITLDKLLREDKMMVKEVSEEQRKGVGRKRILSVVIPLFILSLLTTGYFLYQEVDSVRNVFSPSTIEIVNLDNPREGWSQVTFDDEPFLNMGSIFWEKEVVNHANNESKVEIRITDMSSDEKVYQIVVEPGESYSLEDLKRNTDYLVEVRGDQEAYFLTFS